MVPFWEVMEPLGGGDWMEEIGHWVLFPLKPSLLSDLPKREEAGLQSSTVVAGAAVLHDRLNLPKL